MNIEMAELEVEIWRFNDREAVWNVVVLKEIWRRFFVKREDKNILNQLSFIPSLYRNYHWIIKVQ